MFYLTIVNKTRLTVTLGWHDSRNSGIAPHDILAVFTIRNSIALSVCLLILS